ncbi:hypothetical protein [Phycicoccus duodecadis]|uniref:Uncharacterized protein n=1 Tax=Phycicoccus duodecadis TaxID=173053 RepID=A0A2N3YMV3_9MICO|nr:hypothetical protein [Phycicoccus duodecadis]PKW28195.1 hypothetical protein ATL31_3053 [Phycicoccus duodecadis]
MNRTTHTTPRPGLLRLAVASTLGVALLAASAVAGVPAMAHDAEATPTGSSAHSRDGAGAQLAALKKSLAVYQDVTAATAAGFIPVSECTVSDAGGMGVHYLNPALAAQAPDPARPAILLYAPTSTGGLRLLGAEWFQADADQDLSTDADRPSLFGQPFNGPMAGHDPMMPVHYDLHVWLYDSNPDGVFAPWNPSVHC